MNIGIIIFIISVIITGVSALRDKVTRTDKIKDPIKTSNEQHQEGGFFEKLEKLFKKLVTN